MSSFKRRVDGLDDSLSPTEIVLRWLQEVAGFPSADDYVASIKDKPSSAWPLHRLTQEAERAATASSKGLPRDTIDRKVREAVRDVVFFFHLHLELNSRISDELRVASPSLALLAVDLNHRMREDARRSDAALAWMRACHELPYPARCSRPPPPSRPPSSTASSPGACSARPRPSRSGSLRCSPRTMTRSRRRTRSRDG